MSKNIFSFFTKQKLSAEVLKQVSADVLSFLEQFPTAVVLVTGKGKIGLVNPAAAALLQKEPGELVGQNIADWGITSEQLTAWQKDGVRHIIELTDALGQPLKLQAGAKALGESSFVTLTLEEVPQFTQLRQENVFFQAILNQYPCALTVQDQSGKCIVWNEAAGRLFGVSAEQAQGKMLYQSLPKKLSAMLYGLDEELKAGKMRKEPVRFSFKAGEKAEERILVISKYILPAEGSKTPVTVTLFEDATARLSHEQDLQRSKKLLHAVLENIPLGLYTRDCDEKITFFNKQSMQILNETSPYRADHPNQYQQDSSLQEYRVREQQILKDGKTYEYPEEVYTDSSGKKKIVHMIKVPLFDAGPKPMVLSIVEDVTKRREQEQEIQRINSFFSAVVQNAPIALYARAEDGHMLLRNKQCTELFGPVTKDDYDDRGGLAHETDEQVTSYLSRERDILQTGKTLDIPEEEYINAKGERKLLHIIKTPVQEGRCVLTLAEDITFKKEQERALLESKNFLQTVINQLPVSLSVKNYAGQYILWNKKSEELFGVEAKDVIGKQAYRSDLNKEQAEFIRETDLRVFENKKEQNIPQELISSPNVGIKIMHTVKTPVFNADGTPDCLLIVSEDITAKTKMEKQIREANDKNTLLVENAREGVVIVEDGKIIYANYAFCKMLGSENLDAIKGKPLLDFASDNHRMFLKEKYEAVRSGADNNPGAIEVHFKHADDSEVEARFSAVLAKYMGRRVVLGFASDITADNHALRDLKNERNNFRQAFEKNTAAAVILSPRGYVSRMNEAARRLFGFTEADKKFYCNVYVRPALALPVRRAMKEGRSVRVDYTLDFDKAAKRFPGRISKEGKLSLSLSFEPLSKRNAKDGSVEAEYLICVQPSEPETKAEPPSVPPATSAPVQESQPPETSFAKTARAAGSLPPLPPFLVQSKKKNASEVQLVLPNSEPYALCDEHFVITDCNDLLCSLCELQKDELMGQDIRHLFSQDEAPLVAQDFKLLAKDGKLFNREYTIELGSGLETCKIRLTAEKTTDNRYLFVLRSLAFHLQIMKILEERSSQLSALRAITDGAVLRVTFNNCQLGQMELLNNWLTAKTGYLHEDLTQMSFGDLFFDPSQEDESPALVLAKAQDELVKQGKTFFTLPFRNKDGSSCEAAVSLSVMDIPSRNEVLAVIRNLTAQQAAWGKASKEAQELTSLRQTLPGLYLRMDAKGKVLEVSSNLAGIDDVQAQELFLGKTPDQFWPGEAAARAMFTLKESLAVHVSSHFEFEWPRSGETCYYEADVSPLKDVQEAVVWVKDASEKRIYDRHLHDLYRLSQETGLSMTEQVDKLLDLGKKVFQADIGLVLRLEPRKERMSSVVLYASENSFDIERGMEFAVEECLRDVADGTVVLLPDLSGLSCGHCLHREKKLGALLAAPLVVDGQVEGMLCFAARDTRRRFAAGAEEFLGLMARLLALRIELRQADKLLGAAARMFTRTLDDLQVPALRVDPDFLITYVNEPLMRWLNRKRESLVGRELFSSWIRHADIARRTLQETVRNASGSEPCQVKWEVLLPSGIYEEMTWEVFVCRGTDGVIEGYALIAQTSER